MRQQDWERARVALEKVVASNPDDGEALLLLAKVYGEMDWYDNMRLTVNDLVALSPKYEPSQERLQRRYWIRNFNLGQQYFENKDYGKAIERFEMVVLLDSVRAIGYQKLADANFMSGRYHEAKKAYMRFLEQEPANLVVKNNLAEIYFIEKNYQAVIDLSNEILTERPADVNSLMRRAYAYEALDKFKLAERDLLKILESDEGHEIRTDLGLLYFRHGDFKKSIVQFTQALKTAEDADLLYRYLGEANRMAGNYPEMAKWYLKIVEENPDDLMSWKNLAIAYEALGARDKLAKARGHINKLESTN